MRTDTFLYVAIFSHDPNHLGPLCLEGSLSFIKLLYYTAEMVYIGAFSNLLEGDPDKKVLQKVVGTILNLTG